MCIYDNLVLTYMVCHIKIFVRRYVSEAMTYKQKSELSSATFLNQKRITTTKTTIKTDNEYFNYKLTDRLCQKHSHLITVESGRPFRWRRTETHHFYPFHSLHLCKTCFVHINIQESTWHTLHRNMCGKQQHALTASFLYKFAY